MAKAPKAPKEPKTTKPSKLNMLIARSHRLSQRLIGVQMTTGTLVGITLSACQMSAGFLVVGWWFIDGNPLLVLLIVIIGCALATLIERLSLGGLGGTRVMLGDLTKVREEYDESQRQAEEFYRSQGPATPEQLKKREEERARGKERLAVREKSLKHSIAVSITFSVVGMVLSFGLGDLFWHVLFEKAGAVGWVLSSACSIVISLTFIHSELFKPLMDRLLTEILRDLQLMKTAVAAEGQSMQVEILASAFDAVRESADVRKPAQQKVEKTVIKSLGLVADEYSALEGQVTIYEDKLPGNSRTPLALPAPRSKYEQHKEELKRQLAANPKMSEAAIAAYFTISKSTAHAWMQKVRVP